MGGTLLATTPFQNLSDHGSLSKTGDSINRQRRSVYLPVLRSAALRVFQAFDFPDPAVLNGDRPPRRSPSQALFMMNGQIVDPVPPSGLADDAPERRRLNDQAASMERACRRIPRTARVAEELSRSGQSFLKRYQAAPSLARASGPERRATHGLAGTLQGNAVIQRICLCQHEIRG